MGEAYLARKLEKIIPYTRTGEISGRGRTSLTLSLAEQSQEGNSAKLNHTKKRGKESSPDHRCVKRSVPVRGSKTWGWTRKGLILIGSADGKWGELLSSKKREHEQGVKIRKWRNDKAGRDISLCRHVDRGEGGNGE